MNLGEAREIALQLLRTNGKAKNSDILKALGGDNGLLEQVREDLLFEGLAEDVRGAGLSCKAAAGASDAPLPPPAAVPRRLVFISYGRADATAFAKKLAGDLQQHAHRVFLDLEDIRQGESFDVRIEYGIRQADVLAAVMSHRSLAEDSVCRDEVVFALQSGRPILPLRIVADPSLKPTILLARRNWIDFSEDYASGLQSLLRYLAGDKSALRAPVLAMVTGAIPLDFSADIAKFSERFTGREWLTRELDDWLARSNRRAFVITAPAGTGKSAIAAWLYRTRNDVVGIYFCTQRNTRTRDPHEFVACLVGQLQAEIPELAGLIGEKQPELRRNRASDAFSELIVETSRSLPPQSQKRLIIVDSLDEGARQTGETVLDVLTTQAKLLPDWLRIVATTRPEEPILDRLRGLSVYELRTDREENLADVRQYIHARLRESVLSEIVGDASAAIAMQVEARAAGVFLQAELTLDDLVDGALSVRQLTEVARDQAFSYRDAFQRRFPDAAEYARQYAPILQALVVAREPLSFGILRCVTGLPADALRQRLDRLGSYIQVAEQAEDATYRLVHQSLQDWLTDAELSGAYFADQAAGDELLCNALIDAWRDEQYALRHLPAHLIAAGRWDDLETLLTDLPYLEAKTHAGRVFELAGDFSAAVKMLPQTRSQRRTLRLLDEALRRDIHFIARHAGDYPQALFQCLWNSCWWYDSPQAAAHYDAPENVAPRGELPWERSEDRLYELLETWRAAKERASTRWCWIRSLRPPPVALGSGLKAVLRGHEKSLRSTAYSADGRCLATGSDDNTVILWDAGTGQELRRLRGHTDCVMSVAFSPTGDRLLSGARDKTVREWDTETGKELTCLRVHQRGVTSVAYMPDGCRIVSGSRDRTFRLSNVQTGELLWCRSMHGDYVTAVACSPNGLWIADASDDCIARIWNAADGTLLLQCCGHEGPVASLAFSHDGRQVVSGSADRTVRVWDAQTGRELRCLRGHLGCVTSVASSPDGRLFASGSEDQTVRLWHAEHETPYGIWRCACPVRSLTFSPNGRWICSGLADGNVQIWDRECGAALPNLKNHRSTVACAGCSPDGRRIVTGGGDATVRIWDVETGTQLDCLHGHTEGVRNVAYTVQEGRPIVTSASDTAVRTWDPETGKCLTELSRRGAITSLHGTSPHPQWQAAARGLETVIERVASREPVAWFPLRQGWLTCHPAERAWAWVADNTGHLYLVTLDEMRESHPPPVESHHQH